MKSSSKTLFLVQAALIAALYVALTDLANRLGLASQAVQIRFSEALTILPFFTPAAIPGLFIGCILANFLTGAIPWSIPSCARLSMQFSRFLKKEGSGRVRSNTGFSPSCPFTSKGKSSGSSLHKA